MGSLPVAFLTHGVIHVGFELANPDSIPRVEPLREGT